MEYIYAAMLIHKAGGQIDESTVKKVMEAAGAKSDDARIKALVASLQGVNIDEAIEKASAAQVVAAAPAAAAPVGGAKDKGDEKKKEAEEKKSEEAAAAGLGALFG